jgi:phosphotransferase system enzyme I (PtsI)
VVVEPSGPTLEAFRALQETERREEERLQGTRHLPALTRDQVRLRLQANVEFTEEAATAVIYGAEGIGLFRSEYLLGRGRRWPTEDEQVDAYRRLLDQMRPHPVTIRTWDVDLEELSPGSPSSPNPALGERALRLLRRNPEPFRLQLRALLRAGQNGPLRIMFPFATGPSDLRLALDLLGEARDSLRRDGVPFAEDVPVGLNLEVPSAALVADLLAADVEFFSIGTNDLIQYLLAVDRADPRVAGLYQPLHPAVLRIVAEVVRVSVAHGMPVSLCGEMAADPLHAVLLVGLGLRDLSMTPAAIPRVKASLRGIRADHATEIAHHCLSVGTAEEIESILRREFQESLLPADTLKE